MALIRGGITVRAQVQAFADAVAEATGADSFGTYVGHEPSAELAVDTFTQVPTDRRGPGTPGLIRVLGDSVAEFAVANIDRFAIDYVIWRQHIYNPEIAEYWRQMEDRGGITQNHFDHVHCSFDDVDWKDEKPGPTPPPNQLGDAMALSVRYIHPTEVPGEVGNLDWVFDGPSRIHQAVGTLGVLKACDACEFPELGLVDKATHEWFKAASNGWK